MLEIALRCQFGDLVGGELAAQKTVEALAELETRAAQSCVCTSGAPPIDQFDGSRTLSEPLDA